LPLIAVYIFQTLKKFSFCTWFIFLKSK